MAFGLEYDGTKFHGWEARPGDRSVRLLLSDSAKTIANLPSAPVVTCAGRTDQGVHATGQVVHMDLPCGSRRWTMALNSLLPDDVRVLWDQPVNSTFHARYSAMERQYVYAFSEDVPRPTLRNLVYYVRKTKNPLNRDRMQEAAQLVIGTRDFSRFRRASCQAKSPVTTLREFSLDVRDNIVLVKVRATRFLYGMVRMLVGALIEVGRGRLPLDTMIGDGTRTHERFCVPAHGLYFCGAQYPGEHGLPSPILAAPWPAP